MTLTLFFALGCILGLSSCTRNNSPAPVSYGYEEAATQKTEQSMDGQRIRPQPRFQKRSMKSSVPSSLQQEKIIVVKQGENLSRVAHRYGVSEENIKTYNNLKPPYHLFPGQTLNLPDSEQESPRSQPKTVSKLAVEQADFFSPSKKTSSKDEFLVDDASLTEEAVSHASRPRKKNLQPRRSLAEREKELEAKFRALEEARRNTLKEDKKVISSTEMKTSKKTMDSSFSNERGGEDNKQISVSKSDFSSQKAQSVLKEISDENVTVDKENIKNVSPSAEKETTTSIDSPERSNDSSTKELRKKAPKDGLLETFSWPVKGDIISHFNSGNGKLKNDGINISAAKDTPITAAADGTIAYVGNEMKAFGTLILIKHKGGWMSAYGHCGKVFVKPRQAVHKGEKIALVGNSGSVRTPQLHFQLRKKTTMVDPEQHLE